MDGCVKNAAQRQRAMYGQRHKETRMEKRSLIKAMVAAPIVMGLMRKTRRSIVACSRR